jgi:hypothetical protein
MEQKTFKNRNSKTTKGARDCLWMSSTFEAGKTAPYAMEGIGERTSLIVGL